MSTKGLDGEELHLPGRTRRDESFERSLCKTGDLQPHVDVSLTRSQKIYGVPSRDRVQFVRPEIKSGAHCRRGKKRAILRLRFRKASNRGWVAFGQSLTKCEEFERWLSLIDGKVLSYVR